MPFTLNPAVAAALAKFIGPEGPPPPAEIGDVQTRRERANGMFAFLAGHLPPPPPEVETKDFYTKAEDGHDILCRWFYKRGVQLSNSPAVCYSHGGGMIALSIQLFDQAIKHYVFSTGVPFLAIEYRLAPEVQAPVPVKDVYAGLQYLHDHASELGVDPHRIAIMGDSAGGGIAASLAHYAKLKGGPAICKQILIYPMLDDRSTKDDPLISPFLTWSVADNATGWQAYLGKDKAGSENVHPTEAAGRMTVEDAQGLPPAYIEVGELDLFRDEDLEYAKKLGKAGVSCEFHLIPGVPHAAEAFAPTAPFAIQAMELRLKAVMSF